MNWKKVFVIFLLLAVFTGMLPGSGVQADNGKGKAAVRFLVAYPDYFDAYQRMDMVGRYKKFRPSVNLEVDYQWFNPDTFKDTLKNYDVAFIPAFDNVINDNFSLLADIKGLQAAKNNTFVKYCTIDDGAYGIPATVNLEVVWYRKSIFKEYNLAVPKTWDEFIKNAVKIRDGKKYIPIAMATSDHWPTVMFTRSLPCLEYGSSTYWNDMLNQESSFSKGGPYYNALEKFKSLVDNNLISRGNALSMQNESIDLLVNKKAAMLCWKEYLKEHFHDEDIGCFLLPARSNAGDKLNITANVDTYMVISKDCRNRDEVDRFVNWHFSSEWYGTFISCRGYTSTQKNIKSVHFPVIESAFDYVGSNINLVAQNLACSSFYKRFANSRINFFDIASDIYAGRNLEDLCSNLNRQWNASDIAGGPIGPRPEDAGTYKGNEAYRPYVQPSIDYNYQGPSIAGTRDVNTRLDDSVLLNQDYPYAYAYSVKTRLDRSDSKLKPVSVNGCLTVPLGFLHDALGAEINSDDTDKLSILYNENEAVLALDSNDMKTGGRIFRLDVAPCLNNGTIYVPLNGLVENLFGLGIISDGKNTILYNKDNVPGASEKSAYFQRASLIFKNNGLLRITIDPRVELFKIMELLSKTGGDRVTRYDSEYRREVIKYFLPFINHPSVRFFQQHQVHSGTMMSILMYMSPPPALVQEATYSTDALNGLDEGIVNSYMEAMGAFAADTNFMNFYNKNYKIYRIIIQKAEKEAREGKYMDKLTAYYGSKLCDCDTILAPLLAMVSGGPHVEWEPGKLDAYNIITSLQPENNIPAFGTKERLMGIIWHEYGHSYVNTMVEGRWSELSSLSSLADDSDIPIIYGNDWKICVNEYIVRAVTARLIYKHSGKKAGDDEIRTQKEQGFIYIGDICKKLEAYENNRTKYPKLLDFLPEIIKVFKSKIASDGLKNAA